MRKREKIFILPTGYGLMYGGGIFASLIGGAIYNNNLAFLLCFFLVALFLIGMIQTHNNLKNIEIEKLILFLSPSEGQGHGVIWIKSHNNDGHSQVRLSYKAGGDQIEVNIPSVFPNSLHPQYFDFKTGDWGKKLLKKATLSTRFPFGFFHVWRNYKIQVEYFIYPRPAGRKVLQGLDSIGQEATYSPQLEGDDFSEHRRYQWGDSQKHIDWKAYARGRPLLTKKFNEGQRKSICINFEETQGDMERRFRQMSQWIHECHDDQVSYSMRIKDQFIPSNHGDKHKVNCLKLLTSFRESA